MGHFGYFLLLILIYLPTRGQAPGPDFISAEINLVPDPAAGRLEGSVSYQFLAVSTSDSLILDAHNMDFSNIRLDGVSVPYAYDGRQLGLDAPRDNREHQLFITYSASPRQAVYFLGWNDDVPGNEQVWTQGQGKYTSHWLPSFDNMREKVVFDINLWADPKFSVVANGELTQVANEKLTGKALKKWSFDMDQPMSSYLLAFAIGKFDSLEMRSAGGIPIYGYYPAGEKDKAAIAYHGTEALFNFLEADIGVPYPWRDYKQVPVRDFMYAGMENTGATLFSDTYLVDSIGMADRPYLNVNAHELAHQWFGNLVTETDGEQHWLHEGFATYYAYRAESHLLGEEAANWKWFRSAKGLQQLAESQGGESLVDPGAGSLTFYEKGAWALKALRDLVGEQAFRQGIQTYLKLYAHSNATVDEFLEVMEGVSGQPLNAFRKIWLESKEFPAGWCYEHLSKLSSSIAAYRSLEAKIPNGGPDSAALGEAWAAFEEPAFRAAITREFSGSFNGDLWELAFSDSRPEIQKALLEGLPDTEAWMQPRLEEFLNAMSYEVRESTLFRLWNAFPEKRGEYLDYCVANGSKEQPEFRQMWWLLALFTEGYASQEQAASFLNALQGTTAPSFGREIRENGFRLLHQVRALSEQNLKDLLGATEHHSWQFRLFARRLFDELLQDRPERSYWSDLASTFDPDQYRYIYEKINSL